MRLITVMTPKGFGQKVSKLAFNNNISEVAISEAKRIKKDSETVLEVVSIQTNTRKTKSFIEALMKSDFYDPKEMSFSTREPESQFASALPKEETYPLIRTTGEVYEEFYQYSQISISMVFRVFLSAVLVAYGMREGYMPLIIAGLLFLPYHHFLLGMGIGAGTKELRLFGRAALAYFLGTILIMLAGIFIGLLIDPGIKFHQFLETKLLFNVILSITIGIAAGFGAVDDAGRRELIGLAATAHLSVYPVWFGLKFVYGFDAADKPWEALGMFVMDTFLISLFAFLVFKLMKMRGKGIRKFVRSMK